jgi:hypothetical protein
MALTREDVRASVERAGDEHWQALIAHHEDAYPASSTSPSAMPFSRSASKAQTAPGVGGLAG